MVIASAGSRRCPVALQERYYREKLHISHADAAGLRSLVQHYIEGLEWVLQYYYRGVASWDWFYPHHFAPMASECTHIASLQPGFAMGQPFQPFQQLLAVLPASSSKLLPQAYWVSGRGLNPSLLSCSISALLFLSYFVQYMPCLCLLPSSICCAGPGCEAACRRISGMSPSAECIFDCCLTNLQMRACP